jgi:hypothetical protein
MVFRMRLRLLLLSLLLMPLLPDIARAGAWPRSDGATFVSVSTRVSWPKDMLGTALTLPSDRYDSFYLEHGLTEQMTIGLDLGRAEPGGAKLLAFAQLPLDKAENGPQTSVQLAFGTIEGQAVLRPGLMLGWGRDGGWMGADAMVEYAPRSGDTSYKLDLTWGRTLGQDRLFIVQVQTGKPEGERAFARLAPSYVMPIGKTLKVEFGATVGLRAEETIGLKLGLWSEF